MSSNLVSIRAFSGDLLNRCTQKNKRRHSLIASTEEEVLLGFSDVFNDQNISEGGPISLRSNKSCPVYPQIKCSNYPRCHEFNVKIFAHEINPNLVEDAVNSILTEMNFTFVDSLVLSLHKNITNKQLLSVWKQMEQMKNSGKVGSIGVADLSVDQVEYLSDWASICPDLVQICPLNYNELFSESESTVRKLTQIGQSKNIRITTHNDPVCSPQKLVIDLDSVLDTTDKKIRTVYTGRYTQRSKDRNIITMKGYYLGIARE